MPSLGEFDNIAEFTQFEKQMRDAIVNRRWKNHTIPDMDDEEIDERLLPWLSEDHWDDPSDGRPTLDSLHIHVRDTGELPDVSLVRQLWYGVRDLYEPNLSWGFWTSGTKLLTDKDGEWIGYSSGDKLITSQLLSSSSIIQHIYSDKPDPVSWTLLPHSINQGDDLGLVAYIGIARFDEIEAVSQVPWIDPGLSSEDFANNVLDEQMKSQWQRKIDARRIVAIQTFAESAKNTMFNPITLYVQPEHMLGDNPVVSFDSDDKGMASVKINFDFLYGRPGSYHDFVIRPEPGQDQRPLWLVDGQHRTRGFGASSRGSGLEVPIVLLMDEDGYDGDTKDLIARVFTEINTGASPLERLHKIFLKYAFNMPSSSPRDHWEDYEGRDLSEVDRSMIRGSWANRRAYESALNISSERLSPLRNCMQFQKPSGQRASHHLVSNSHVWVENVRNWFLPGNIYSPIPNSSEEVSLEEELGGMEQIDGYYNQEILNFLCAFMEICNRFRSGMWETGSNKNKQLFQFMGTFPALLMTYPFVVNKIVSQEGDLSRPINQSLFEEVMEPLANVDWKNRDLRARLGGRTNTNRKHISEWMKRTIDAGISQSAEDIFDEEFRGVSGKGLISMPPEAVTSQISPNSWPEEGRPLIIRMDKPPNTLTDIWEVEIDIPNGRGGFIDQPLQKGREGYKSRRVDWERNNFPTDEGSYSDLIIELRNVRNAKQIRVKGSWRNGIGQGGKSDELVFDNPE